MFQRLTRGSRTCVASRLHKAFVVLGGALLLLLLLPHQAQAHAQYDHSNPSANARLASGHPPAVVQVWFTEQIEPAFSRLAVYDKERHRVDQNDSHSMPNDSYALTVSLRPRLPDGAYTVVFENVSRQDGHHVKGNFGFVVGVGPLPTNTSTLLDQAQTADENFTIWSVTTRWLNYLGMATLVGSLTFVLFVWHPGLSQLDGKTASALREVEGRIALRSHALLLCSLILLTGGWIAFLFYQASTASQSSLGQIVSDGALHALLLKSQFGVVWLIRLGLIVCAFFVWYWCRNGMRRILQWLLLFLGAAIMLTTSLNSHAAASHVAWLLLPADLVHLVSTGVWIGGLFSLVFLLPLALRVLVPGTGDRTRLLAVLIPRFSRVALASVILLTITGTIQAVVQLSSLNALLTSSYGLALTIKLGLFGLLLCLGAYNLLVISPKMRSFAQSTSESNGASSFAAGSVQRAFQRAVVTEGVLVMLVLLVVGGLTSLSPPQRSTIAPETRAGGALIHKGQAADISYLLVINPAKVGSNSFEVELTGKDGKPIQQTDAVMARFIMLDMDMGLQEVEMQHVPNTPGRYMATSSVLSMSGRWEGVLVVRRTGFDDVKTSFLFDIRE